MANIESSPEKSQFPEGSLPSVPPPSAVPTGSRIGSPEVYAFGGWPVTSPGDWVVEAAQKRTELFHEFIRVPDHKEQTMRILNGLREAIRNKESKS